MRVLMRAGSDRGGAGAAPEPFFRGNTPLCGLPPTHPARKGGCPVTLRDALAIYPGAVAYCPGDSPALNAEVLGLMRSGAKVLTCDAWERSVAEGLPVVGRVDIAMDWDRAPALATRTLAVERLRFCDVSEAMIPPQAEFRDLAEWRRGYTAYLTRAGIFHPEIEMMFETFEVVRDFAEDRL